MNKISKKTFKTFKELMLEYTPKDFGADFEDDNPNLQFPVVFTFKINDDENLSSAFLDFCLDSEIDIDYDEIVKYDSDLDMEKTIGSEGIFTVKNYNQIIFFCEWYWWGHHGKNNHYGTETDLGVKSLNIQYQQEDVFFNYFGGRRNLEPYYNAWRSKNPYGSEPK